MTAKNPWRTRAARKIRAQVLHAQPTCQLQLPGCTGLSTTVDHIIPQSQRPDLTLTRANLQGACDHCNRKRSNANIDTLRPPHALNYFTKTIEAQHD